MSLLVIHWLRHEWEERRGRRSRYSLRAFARDIQVSPSSLSEILQGKSGLSGEQAAKISEKLGWGESRRAAFCTAAVAKSARSANERIRAKSLLQTLLKSMPNQFVGEAEESYTFLSHAAFQVIASWEHFALLETLEIASEIRGTHLENWASRLGISPARARKALGRLEKLGLVNKDSLGNWFNTESHSEHMDDVPCLAIQQFHRQMLVQAGAALAEPIERREFGNLILAFAEKEMGEAKKMLQEFLKQFSSRFGSSADRDHVYSLSVQFFEAKERKVMKR